MYHAEGASAFEAGLPIHLMCHALTPKKPYVYAGQDTCDRRDICFRPDLKIIQAFQQLLTICTLGAILDSKAPQKGAAWPLKVLEHQQRAKVEPVKTHTLALPYGKNHYTSSM